MTHPNSPNGCWKRHGYIVHRDKRRRKIFKPDGELLFDHGPAGYDVEMEYIEKHGMLLTEAAT